MLDLKLAFFELMPVLILVHIPQCVIIAFVMIGNIVYYVHTHMHAETHANLGILVAIRIKYITLVMKSSQFNPFPQI